MKKIWTLLLIVASAFCVVGCGSKESFDESYNSILKKISHMNEQTDYATEFIDTTWQVAGADLVNEYIYQVKQINSKEDLNLADKISKDMLFNLFSGGSTDTGDQMMKTAWLTVSDLTELESSEAGDTLADSMIAITDSISETCIKFNTSRKDIEKNNKEVKELLNSLKDKYGDEYSSEIDNLKEYYTESSLYADLALNPGGCTLSEYEQDCDDYSNNIKRLKKIAE